MHLNDLAELLATYNGRIEGSRDTTGATIFKIELSDGRDTVQATGSNMKSALVGAHNALRRRIKNRDVVHF